MAWHVKIARYPTNFYIYIFSPLKQIVSDMMMFLLKELRALIRYLLPPITVQQYKNKHLLNLCLWTSKKQVKYFLGLGAYEYKCFYVSGTYYWKLYHWWVLLPILINLLKVRKQMRSPFFKLKVLNLFIIPICLTIFDWYR